MEALLATVLPFVLLAALVLLILYVLKRHRSGMGKTFAARLTVPESADQVREAAVRAVSRIGRVTIDPGNPGEIQATVGATWASWGEIITVRVRPVGPSSAVDVESRSKLGTTVIDWGKNRRNVEKISAELLHRR
jgi:hypothetical protein